MIKQKWQSILELINDMEQDIDKSDKNNKSAALRVRKQIKQLQAELKDLRAISLKVGKEYRIPTDLSVVGLDVVNQGTSGGGGGGY